MVVEQDTKFELQLKGVRLSEADTKAIENRLQEAFLEELGKIDAVGEIRSEKFAAMGGGGPGGLMGMVVEPVD